MSGLATPERPQTDPRGVPQHLVYRRGGQQRHLPITCVLGVSHAAQAASLPFASPPFEGLITRDGRLVAQFDLAATHSGAAGNGRYAVALRTELGDISLRVDSAAFTAAPPPDDAPPGLPEIDALLSGFAPAEPAPAPARRPDPPPLRVLLLRSGGEMVAFPAATVQRLDRHLGVWPSATDARELEVAVGDDLLPGRSLAGWLGRPAPEPWAIVTEAKRHAAAILVSEVLGLAAVPAERVRCLPGGGVRLLGLGPAPVALLAPASIAVGQASPPDLGTTAAPPVPQADPRAPDAADGGDMAATVDTFSCVFPLAMVAEVSLSRPPPSPRRAPGSQPVFELSHLLGLPAPPDASRMALHLRRRQRSVILRAPLIERAAPLPAWQPPPVLPSRLAALVSGVRLRGGHCDLLVREAAFLPSERRKLAAFGRVALAGWLDHR